MVHKIILGKSSEPASIKTVSVVSNKDQSKIVDLVNGVTILQYHESILSETISVNLTFVDSGYAIKSEEDDTLTTAVEGLPIVGTETIKIQLEDNNEHELNLELYINKVTPLTETSTVNTCNIECVSKEFLLNEKIRVNTRFDGKISDHIKKIVQDIPEYFSTEKKIDIEDTDNNYNFCGNNRKPFFTLNALSKKSVPSGKLGKSAGFFFWETSEGFKFKSIDTLMDSEKNPIKMSVLYDNTPDGKGASLPPEYDMKALQYSEDNATNIKNKYTMGAYSTKIITFDPYSCEYKITTRTVKDDATRVSGTSTPEDEGSEKNLTTGGEELPVLNPVFDRKGLDKEYSRTTYYVNDTGTLPTGSGLGNDQEQLNKSQDPNFVQSQIVNQSIRRYNQFYASKVTVTLPGDFSLHAGDAIFVDAPAVTAEKKGEVNKRTGGLYIITDLCHYVSVDGTYTKCNLVRDSFGRQGTPLKG